MAFLESDDILVLERPNGTVKRIVHGTMLPEPLLDVNITSDGLLGIATSKNDLKTYVFLYYTAAPRGHSKDIDVSSSQQVEFVNNSYGYARECDCLYRYELVDGRLINVKLLIELPTKPGGYQHHGGEVIVGPDDNIYMSNIIGPLLITEEFRISN